LRDSDGLAQGDILSSPAVGTTAGSCPVVTTVAGLGAVPEEEIAADLCREDGAAENLLASKAPAAGTTARSSPVEPTQAELMDQFDEIVDANVGYQSAFSSTAPAVEIPAGSSGDAELTGAGVTMRELEEEIRGAVCLVYELTMIRAAHLKRSNHMARKCMEQGEPVAQGHGSPMSRKYLEETLTRFRSNDVTKLHGEEANNPKVLTTFCCRLARETLQHEMDHLDDPLTENDVACDAHTTNLYLVREHRTDQYYRRLVREIHDARKNAYPIEFELRDKLLSRRPDDKMSQPDEGGESGNDDRKPAAVGVGQNESTTSPSDSETAVQPRISTRQRNEIKGLVVGSVEKAVYQVKKRKPSANDDAECDATPPVTKKPRRQASTAKSGTAKKSVKESASEKSGKKSATKASTESAAKKSRAQKDADKREKILLEATKRAKI